MRNLNGSLKISVIHLNLLDNLFDNLLDNNKTDKSNQNLSNSSL
jgi:hypothetical protein